MQIPQTTVHQIFKIYYSLTSTLPRTMPMTKEEFDMLKTILMNYYEVEDTPSVWYAVSGHIQNGGPAQLKKSYGYLSRVAKRLKINAVAQDQKVVAELALKARLEELTKKMKEEDGAVPEGPCNLQPEMHVMQNDEARLVSTSRSNGI